MRKQMILMAYAFLMIQVVACGNNESKKIKDVSVQKDGIAAIEEKNIFEMPKAVTEEDTSRYRIEYVLYKDVLRENPNYIKNWSLKEGLNPYTVHSIKFIEKQTNKVVNEYNIEQQSPYPKLNYRIIARGPDANIYYRITPSNNILNDLFQYKLNYSEDTIPFRAVSSYKIENRPNKQCCIIAYSFECFNKASELVSRNTFVRVLSNIGENIGEISKIKEDVFHPTVTNNGKYIAFLSSGKLNDRTKKIGKDEINIFQIQTEKQVAKIIEKDREEIALPIGHNYTIQVGSYNLDTEETEYNIFDLEREELYQKKFNLNNPSLILKEINDLGMRFSLPNKEDYFIEYKKDFKTSKIQNYEK